MPDPQLPTDPLNRPPPDARRTLFKALAILVMLVISVIGMCYVGWLIWTHQV